VGRAHRDVTLRAVILARGLGTRMRRTDGAPPLGGEQAAAADAGLKAMMPIGRPFIDYILSALADAGIEEACLVIGPEHAGVRAHFAEGGPRRVGVRFAVQERPLGTADAVLAAEEFTAGGRFMVLNGDNYYPVPVLARMASVQEPAVAAFSRSALLAGGQIPPERIERFAILDIGGDGYLRRIVEKPESAALATFGPDPRVSMNCWVFDSRVFDACRALTPSPRGELELPLAVQAAIDAGAMRVRAVMVEAPVLDLSSRADVAAVTAGLAGVAPRP
jgi:glucose-1-phosphate thymidylyltransferase